MVSTVRTYTSFLEQAIRAGGYSGPGTPSIACHLVGGDVMARALEDTGKITLDPVLAASIEGFLAGAGVKLSTLSVLKADRASEAIILTARGQNPRHQVAIKLTAEKGIYEKRPHAHEDLIVDAIQQEFPSARVANRTLLVRIEPLMRPVDKVIAELPEPQRGVVSEGFSRKMAARIRAKGLADIDVAHKSDNFGVPEDFAILPGEGTDHIIDRLAVHAKILDIGAVRVPDGGAYVESSLECSPTTLGDLFASQTALSAVGRGRDANGAGLIRR